MTTKHVYICYGWVDNDRGKNYIVYSNEAKAKEWVKQSERLCRIFYDDARTLNALNKDFEKIHSELCNDYKYEKMEIN